jgi:hypothetical protein
MLPVRPHKYDFTRKIGALALALQLPCSAFCTCFNTWTEHIAQRSGLYAANDVERRWIHEDFASASFSAASLSTQFR